MKNLTFLVILAFLASCSKSRIRKDEISGHVRNLTTDSYFSEVTVKLIEEHIPSEPFSPISRTVLQSTTTDAGGRFEFEPLEKTRMNRDYYVEVEESPNLALHGWQMQDYDRVHSVVRLEKGETEDLELTTVPFGDLILNVVNSSSSDIQVLLTLSNPKGDFVGLSGSIAEGETFFRPATKFIAGEFDVVWEIVANGDTVMFEDMFEVRYAEDQVLEFEYPVTE